MLLIRIGVSISNTEDGQLSDTEDLQLDQAAKNSGGFQIIAATIVI
jgi:hypothetical protein